MPACQASVVRGKGDAGVDAMVKVADEERGKAGKSGPTLSSKYRTRPAGKGLGRLAVKVAPKSRSWRKEKLPTNIKRGCGGEEGNTCSPTNFPPPNAGHKRAPG